MGSTIVEALYQYDIDLPNGNKETVSPGDKFKLIKKSNDDWWYVQFGETGAAFYLPASYLKELNQRTAHIEVTPPPPSEQPEIEENGSKNNRFLDELQSGLKRRGSAPPGSSFRTGSSSSSARFHHEPPIQETDNADENHSGPLRPSQLNVQRDHHEKKPGKESPQSPEHEPPGYPSGDPSSGEWKELTDQQGRKYYFNQNTRQTQWEAPRGYRPTPMVRSPTSMRRGSEGSVPTGWKEERGSNGEKVFTHLATNAIWYSSLDMSQGDGKRYYYSNDNPDDVRWQLPEMRSPGSRLSYPSFSDLPLGPGPNRNDSGNILHMKPRSRGIDSNRPSSMYSDRRASKQKAFQRAFPEQSNLVMETVPESDLISPTSSCSSSSSSSHPPHPHMIAIHSPSSPILPLPPMPPVRNVSSRRYSDSVEDISPEAIPLEKEGILSKLKLTENGKKVKPKWVPCYTTLIGSKLSFYKDIKNVEKGNNGSSPTGPPDYTFELYGAELKWPKNERAKLGRKFAFELDLPANEILVQGETEEDCLQWFQAINNGIRALGPNQRLFSQSNKGDIFPDSPEGKGKIPKSPIRENAETDFLKSISKSKIKDKLKSFITKRPNPEYLKEKGILKEENVFGKRLVELCHKEKSTVPSFILSCIEAIDNRGLEVDGIYRVSGNLSMIQKLRLEVDQEKPVNLNNSPWSDIHVIAGSLKLFFRELPEPLFTYDAYDRFIQCSTNNDTKSRIKRLRELLHGLPKEHKDTIYTLFAHFQRVIEQGEKNRMKAQNIAIVFGPTLMWSKNESFNLATNLVLQNRLIELILTDHEQIFR
ncbi:rho GTPase-activating protein 12-like isoform X2 [Apostichopus japonicus]|uniref:rho GTPase-activating protein 12-like isoform X2 n=1 Tax=Stichopus japonicus TaxID=307972 RepID=UPI003AB11975